MPDDFHPATPRVAAGVLFRDAAGAVLLVKPTYKPGWDLPGGYVEPGESPKAAAERELAEELGVHVPVGRLLVVDWAPSDAEGDKLLFIFDGGTLDLDLITHGDREIGRVEYVPLTELTDHLNDRLLGRVRSAVGAGAVYLEHGVAP